MKYLIKLNLVVVLLGMLFLSGCAQTQLKDLSEVKSDEMVYVVKVSLNPHISKEEIRMKSMLTLGVEKDVVYKLFYLKASDTYYTLEAGHSVRDMDDTVVVVEGDYAFFTWKKDKPLNILGGWFYTSFSSGNIETMMYTIDGGVKVSHSNKANAVYVGNITFDRDEFFKIKDVELTQKDLDEAQIAFREKFNSKWNLEKAQLSSAK